MESLRTATLFIAVLAVGVICGVMFLYANAIMPGLKRTDDRTFVGAFQAIDTAIINPIFLPIFFGSLIFTGLAVLLHLNDDYEAVLPWLIAAVVLYLVVIVITVAVNVPLNDAIKAAGSPDGIDVAATRRDFNEARWVQWTLVRLALTLGTFGCLAWALVLHGRVKG